jgi:hypothetical protein
MAPKLTNTVVVRVALQVEYSVHDVSGVGSAPVFILQIVILIVCFTLYRTIKKKVTLSHVYNEVTSEPTITRYTTIVRKTLKVCLDTERLLLWSRHFATRSSLAAAARNTFPRQLQTNFESFQQLLYIA